MNAAPRRLHLIVDAANVVGSRPDGWWRDRAGAARRLLDRLAAYAAATGDEVIAVLDSGPPEWAGERDGVRVLIAPHPGRDAADEVIVRRVAEDSDPGSLTVATSDRALAMRVRRRGASVEGGGAFQRRLDVAAEAAG
jgi:predicted RNA-binding protein with PIN domain